MSEGIPAGFPDGTFRPTRPVSRQALITFMYRMAGSPDGADPSCSSPPFTDVPTSNTFCGEITWAEDEITNGYPDGTFRPAESVTRQAFAAFLFRFDDLAAAGALRLGPSALAVLTPGG